MTDFFKKHTLITGTLLLTATGFITRVLGFFYRIFLSRTIGAEGLGLYNMVHPIYGICFGICAGSIQTAISRFVAAGVRQGKRIFFTGLAISLTSSLGLAWAILAFAGPVAHYLLLEDRCAALLPFMAVSVPFSAVHACINGYYYGIQKTRVPALAQIVEQMIRMAAVFLIADILLENGRAVTVELAVAGHLIGEIASCLYTMICFLFFQPGDKASGGQISPARTTNPSTSQSAGIRAGSGTSRNVNVGTSADSDVLRNVNISADTASDTSRNVSPGAGTASAPSHHSLTFLLSVFAETAPPLMALALPLMGNRLILNILASAESIWIPSRLCAWGLTSSEAFSVYGVLTGMAMPFILFPSAITNSMAVLLLPAVSEAQSAGQQARIRQTISRVLRYSLYMGILCIGVFTRFGGELGVSVFHDASAGAFMEILAWLCPFLYLSTTTGSILNDLGRPQTTFFQSAAALLLRIGFVLFGIPRFGILAYLWGMLISEAFLALMHLWSLKRIADFDWNVWEMAVRPAAFLLVSIGVRHFFENGILSATSALRLPAFFGTALQAGVLSLCYGGLLALTHVREATR